MLGAFGEMLLEQFQVGLSLVDECVQSMEVGWDDPPPFVCAQCADVELPVTSSAFPILFETLLYNTNILVKNRGNLKVNNLVTLTR